MGGIMESILICIGGGSASGKTTVVEKITKNLDKGVTVISQDDYYADLTHLSLEERYNVNYDHPDSIDHNLLYEQLTDLLNGKEINKPEYDFVQHNRMEERSLVVPAKVIILEGIFALYDDRIRDLSSMNIFVEADEDIRFIRRLVRDTALRGRSQEMVINQYLKTVKPMFHKFVKPTKRYADIIIPNNKVNDVAIDIIITKITEIIGG